jgi:TPR repeat protein
MSAGEEKLAALVPIETTALTKAGAKSLLARGQADLRIREKKEREEAEEWLLKGRTLRDAGLFAEAFECFDRGIELNRNHPLLQLYLGISFDSGEGTEQDFTEANYWYRQAAEQGEPNAQYFLACQYLRGEGVRQDADQVVVWLRKAAEQGMPQAQYGMGLYNFSGQLFPQNFKEAASWFQKGAEQGHADAQFHLAYLHREGLGVPQDSEQAISWCKKASEQGHVQAQVLLGSLGPP